jgi:hypothetical protein
MAAAGRMLPLAAEELLRRRGTGNVPLCRITFGEPIPEDFLIGVIPTDAAVGSVRIELPNERDARKGWDVGRDKGPHWRL